MNKIISFVFLLFLCAFGARASEPVIWSVDTRAEILRGEARGVSVSDTGAVTLSPKLSKLFDTAQSYVWSSAADTAGNVFLGTGNDGKIFKVDASSKGTLFADLPELDVAALAVGKDGVLYAGTSPDGKVYRIDASGKAELFFDTNDKYIWSLAILNDGSLAVGTGENGKIYRVRQANAPAESSLLFDTSETHIISLATDKQGNLYAGTDSNGLVIRFAPDGKPFALLDAPLREIHDITIGADGSVYALALSDSASASRPNTGMVSGQTPEGTNVTVAVTSMGDAPMPPQSEQQPAKSRYELSSAKSAIFRITPDGATQIIWSSSNVTGFSLLANPNGSGVLLGTSDRGRVYSITNDGRETLLLQSNEGQISTLNAVGNHFLATSSNQGRLYAFGSETLAEGSYESSVRDAKTTALWGRIWWRSAGNVRLQTRTGNTEKPNETWSDWSVPLTDAKGAAIASPKARFLQWRATLTGAAANLSEVNVSYLPQNIAPEVLSIQIMPSNIGLATNPPMPVDPSIENSGVDPQALGAPPQGMMNIPARRIFRRGARSLQWTAEDRNGDKLEYAIYYREASEANYKLLKENFIENFFTLDGLAFPDGRYVFKVVANDSPSNTISQALSGERISEPLDIDNTAPTVSAIGAPQITGDKARAVFEASDAASFIKRAEYSVNGGDWQIVYADDGISDGARERYTLEIPLKTSGDYTVTLRVFDNSGNSGNARVLVRR
jgi:sugar lactone lactonase YvrE